MTSYSQVAWLLNAVASDLIVHEDELRQLDAALGDGDLGITTRMGFGAIQHLISEQSQPVPADQDIGVLLGAAGNAFANANASTMATLLGTAFMWAGKSVKGKTSIELAETVEMFEAALAGIIHRGKAKAGDKTIIDAFLPANTALREAYARGKSCQEAFQEAAQAAQQGVAATVPLQSRVSRAAWLQERSIGHADPGATLGYFIFSSLATHLK